MESPKKENAVALEALRHMQSTLKGAQPIQKGNMAKAVAFQANAPLNTSTGLILSVSIAQRMASCCREIREATTSMTSVPKPLKFLRPHYQTLKTAYGNMKDEANRRKLADVVSVLAITTGKEGDRESLKFRLLGSKVSTAVLDSRVCIIEFYCLPILPSKCIMKTVISDFSSLLL